MANAGIAALASCSELYVHGDQLVTLVPGAHQGVVAVGAYPSFRIERLPTPRLRELLSRSAQWLVPRSDEPAENVVSRVPQWVVPAIATRGHWPGLRPLTSLVTTPVLRPNGTILAAPGYDPATGLFLASPVRHREVPEHPTQADARVAAETLLSVVNHVPFATAADQAAWLAMVLTPLARFAVGAATPLCIVEDSTTSRWSEELIADLASIVGAAPPAAIDADDLLPSPRRSFDALRANGESVVRITNGSARPSLIWRRIYEALQRAQATADVVWFAATTRPTRDLELARIALTTRCEGGVMDRKSEHPPHADAHHPHLLVAALTILRAYQVAGCPDQRLPRWPGFERWSQVVRAAVVWCGLPDPVMTTATVPTTGATDATVADLVAGWAELAHDFPGGCSARQALDALSRAPEASHPRLRAAVAVFASGPLDDRGTADRLGRYLRSHRDEEHEGRALVLIGSGNQGNRWAVRVHEVASPVITSVWLWCSSRSRIAAAITSSPSTVPHCVTAWFVVMSKLPRSYLRFTS